MATYGGNFANTGEGRFTKYYSEDGSFEVTRNNQTGEEKHVLYIGGSPYESNIIFVKNYTESSGSYKFLHKDYLGSILAISDESGNKIEQRHYDAWGNLTHLQVNGGAIVTDENQIRDFLSSGGLLVDRGYTSHEHFAEVGLIHMNGRLYDPLLRRFLNADENIQDMFNTQNYNKYGYVLNNPLMYNDPSGEVFFLIPLVGYFWSAVIVGAVIGAASYLVSSAIMGQAITLKGFLKSTLWGGISGAVTFGIGSIFSVAGSTALTATGTAIKEAVGGVGLAIVQAGTHAVAQGVMSLMQGGTFQQAFWSGALGSLGAYAFGAVVGSDFANKALGQITFGALSGGIGSELTGGNFWQGAVIGGIVAGLNHAMHKFDFDPKPKKTAYEKLKSALDGLGVNNATKEAILSLVKNPDDLGKIGLKFKNIIGVAGKALGAASVGLAINDYIQNPTTAGLVKVISTISALGITTVVSGGVATSVTGWVLSISDAIGASDFIYGEIGKFIDTNFYNGKSLGHEVYKNISNFLTPPSPIYNFVK
ncbi:RHS repeat domain-containing protein [Cruoricaptor ignavus]|nr:RHS repeat-associated core domain-containing protein [Cruoricaptor ignavus]